MASDKKIDLQFDRMDYRDNVSLTRALYATDASMYQILPTDVVVPADRTELLQAVRDCIRKGKSVIARGGGTSLTGQSIGEGVIIDTCRHLNRILELNLDEGWVRVEPGLVCTELNAYLKPHGYRFAPDPATENRANIGGMIANNSAGMRSVRYGMAIDHLLELDLILATGEELHLEPLDEEEWAVKCLRSDREGAIYRDVGDLVARHADEIRARYPKVIRRSGGYALDALVDAKPLNLAKLVCGSEGTLGVIAEAKLKLTPLPRYSAVCLAHFAQLDVALRATSAIVAEGPSAVELIDGVILTQAREHPLTRDICSLVQGTPAAVQIIEVQGNSQEEVSAHIRSIAESLDLIAYAVPVMIGPAEIQAVWQLRSSALGLMTTVKGPKKPVPYIEDAAVPPDVLADYVSDVLEVCRKYDQPVSLFGHSSVGLMHIRPLHDLHQEADRHTMMQIQEEVFLLVMKYGGAWSGEHGDGIVRGGFNRRFFGEQLYDAFLQVKRIFDPECLMNPGKVIDTPPIDAQLRFGRQYRPVKVATQFHFREFGSMLAAAEQCTGVGECRKSLSGVMCPSYMATRDEMHSTRGRANALRLALTGQFGFFVESDELKEALSLCLSCKGCKGECPNGVDMSRLKAEVLYHYHRRQGVPMRTRLFGHFSHLAQLASGPQALLLNHLLSYRLIKIMMENTLGIDRNRSLPAFATQRLSHWFEKRPSFSASTDKHIIAGPPRKVLLFNDSYTEHHQVGVGKAAVEVLESAGYHVELVSLGDSQRSAISQGLLEKAKHDGTKLFEQLDLLLSDKVPLLFCEPSCATAVSEDLPDLLDDTLLASRVASRVQMLDHFLEQELAAGRCEIAWKITESRKPTHFLVHVHCHQKTLDGGKWTHRLLSRIPGAVIADTDAGCCGMAGSFGYEAEHGELSRRIAEQRLLPRIAVEDKDTQVVANGFSCRHQISDLSGRKPLHAVEIVRAWIDL